MIKHLYRIFILFFFYLSFTTSAFSSTIDSLKYQLKHAQSDTAKISVYLKFCAVYNELSPDTALLLANEAFVLAKQNKLKKSMSNCLISMGSGELAKGNFVKALGYFQESLSLRIKSKDKLSIADAYHNIAIAWSCLGDNEKCLLYNLKALVLREQIGNKEMIGTSYNNIGIIYKNMNSYDKALYYYNKSLTIYTQLKEIDHQSSCYGNISYIYLLKHQPEKALEYVMKSKAISEKTNNSCTLALNYANIGVIYEEMRHYEEALTNYNHSLQLLKAMGAESKQANVMQLIAKVWIKKKNSAKALEYALPAYEITKKWNIPIGIAQSADVLSNAYEQLNQPSKAFFYYKISNHINDSLFSLEKEKALANLDAKHDLEEKQKELNLLTIKMKVQRNTTYALLGGMIIIGAISIVIYRLYHKLLSAHHKLVKQQLDILHNETYSNQIIKDISFKSNVPVAEVEKPTPDITQIEETDPDPALNMMAQLIHLMEHEKLYLNSNLTIDKLAEQMSTNKTYLSQLINTYFCKNFNNLINEYRIHEVLLWMTNHENTHLSIEGMALKAGFNNRTTFYDAFKHFTGVTPSFFLNNIHKD